MRRRRPYSGAFLITNLLNAMHRLTRWLRSLGSLVAGYLLLVLTNMLFVIAWFVQPIAAWPPLAIAAVCVPYTLLCALGAGYATAWVAGRRERFHVGVLVALVGVVTVISLVLDVAAEPTWYKLLYFAGMAPATLLGGHLRTRSNATSALPRQ